MKSFTNKIIKITLLLSGTFITAFNLFNIKYMPQTISENNTKILNRMKVKTLIEGGYYYYDQTTIILIAVGITLIVFGLILKKYNFPVKA